MDELSIRDVFPKKLSHYMRENGKSRSDLVRDLGFKYSTVRDWEKGITIPRMDKVEMLANYFGVSNSDLLEEKEKPTDYNDGLSDTMIELLDVLKDVPDEELKMLLIALKARKQ